MGKNVLLKTVFLLAVALVLFVSGVATVFAVQGVTNVTIGPTSTGYVNQSSSQYVLAQAGNVTQVDISAQSITTHWAGFYGNISGNVTLGDSTGHVFYDWSGIGIPSGEVFASNTSAVSWAGIGCMDDTERGVLNTWLGISGSETDNIENTYDSTHPDFTVGGVGVSGCNATNAYTSTGPDASLYYQILLTDTNGLGVFTTLINDSATSFTGNSFDFELLVGEPDSVGTTNMYFYIELD